MGAAEGRDELKRRVRVASGANPDTLTLPSPRRERVGLFRNRQFVHTFFSPRQWRHQIVVRLVRNAGLNSYENAMDARAA